MRIVFCGSGTFGIPTLRAVFDSSHEVVGVFTQPARPAGRGGKLRRTPVADAAAERGARAVECADINAPEAVAAVRAAAADVIVVVDFGQMVRAAVREAAALDAVNLHGSLLPALRGAAPVNWAILRGLPRTGVTVFSLVDRMDAGDVYVQAAMDLHPDHRARELSEALSELGVGAVMDTLSALERGDADRRAQDESQVTLAPRLAKSDGRIDWSADAASVRNRIHGCFPWPGGRIICIRQEGKSVPAIVTRAAVAEGQADGPPGRIDAELCVAAGEGRVRIVEIKPAGKRAMAWRDFANGYRVRAGDRFQADEA